MSKLRNIRAKLMAELSPADAVANFVINKGPKYDYAITLTFPNEVKDYETGERVFGIFIKYLNQRCFRRQKDRIKVFAVQEGLTYKRNHFHCAMQRPAHLDDCDFKRRLRKAWQKVTRDNEVVIDIRNYDGDGWIYYMTKEFTRQDTTGFCVHSNF